MNPKLQSKMHSSQIQTSLPPRTELIPLLEQLCVYDSLWPDEEKTVQRFRQFILNHPTCFERTLAIGHVTGSGLIIDRKREKILLTHHAKLGKWLQLGGHSEGHPIVHETALRECVEESGITDLKLLADSPEIFDLDIHEIPQRKTEPKHLHYDVRYLVVSNSYDFTVTPESNALRWFTLEEAFEVTSERSMHRQFEKLQTRHIV